MVYDTIDGLHTHEEKGDSQRHTEEIMSLEFAWRDRWICVIVDCMSGLVQVIVLEGLDTVLSPIVVSSNTMSALTFPRAYYPFPNSQSLIL